MSRSFKHQPFAAICGNGSAKQDKIFAHRGERRAQNRAIRQELFTGDFEDFLLPHRRECPWNNVYCWVRDGSQRYCGLDHYDWQKYLEAQEPDASQWEVERYGTWPPAWYVEMMRK